MHTHIYTYVCSYTPRNTHIVVHMQNTHIHIFTHPYIHSHLHTQTFTVAYSHLYPSTYACAHPYSGTINTHMDVHMPTLTHTHTHAHLHTLILSRNSIYSHPHRYTHQYTSVYTHSHNHIVYSQTQSSLHSKSDNPTLPHKCNPHVLTRKSAHSKPHKTLFHSYTYVDSQIRRTDAHTHFHLKWTLPY